MPVTKYYKISDLIIKKGILKFFIKERPETT